VRQPKRVPAYAMHDTPKGKHFMDQAFIETNQVVERYLAGKLPLKGAQDFERYCRENPQTLVALGLAERVNAALRLLDAGGQPEPWAEKPVQFHQKLPVFAGVAALAGALAIAALMLLVNGAAKSKRIKALVEEVRQQPLLPAQSTRTVVLMPSRTGPPGNAMVTIGGRATEMADLKMDVSWSKFTNFRVTIDRVEQGRVAVIGNLQKDSNGQLRLALNSSALGPGDYQMVLDGLDWRGAPSGEAWVRFAVVK
jgi:hypothetical protein